MGPLAKRLAALEAFAGRADNGLVIAFMINGVSDEDVVAIDVVTAMNMVLERQPGETLAELVARGKALNTHGAHHFMLFEYSEEAKAHLGKSEDDAVPNTWPGPSPSGHAHHLEHRP